MSSVTTSHNWKLRELDPALGDELARGTSQPPLVGRLLTARGIETVEVATKHLKPSFDGLHDP